MVQWLRLCLPVQGVRVRFLVGELRSHMPLRPKNQNIKQKQYCTHVKQLSKQIYFNCDTIYIYKVYRFNRSVAWGPFTLLSSHYHRPSTGLFSFCRTATLCFLRTSSPFPVPQPLTTTLLLSVTMSVTMLSTSCRWNHQCLSFWNWLISLSVMSVL